MEIVVQGKGIEFFEPNEIILNFEFIKKGNSYEEVLRIGVAQVEDFVQSFLLKNGFQKEDLKTSHFMINEEKKYDNITQQYVSIGFSYTQRATLKFDYDKEKLASLMVFLSKLEDAPVCHVNFGLKDEKECRRQIVAKAYKDAEEQALAIAQAAGKTLERCMKVDFKPFTTDYYSECSLDGRIGKGAVFFEESEDLIMDTFTPADIEVIETLYCLWVAQ